MVMNDMLYGMVFLASLPLFALVIAGVRAARGIQKIYELSPAAHQKKSGTVSMGGIGIVVGIWLATLACNLVSPPTAFCLLVLLGFALIGFLDDFLSVRKNKNLGLTARMKFLIQTILGLTAVLGFHWGIQPLAYWEMALYWLMFNGVSNATNLTDGLDGLLGGLSVVTLAGFAVLFHSQGLLHFSHLMMIGIAVISGFLVFNLHPAKLFMGDTGSLALGAFFVSLSMVLGNPWVLLGLGAVYLIETLSVILQVGSFKLWGRRIFKMAPIHHHFEMVGLNEWQVVVLFWSVGILSTGVTLWIFL